MGTSPFQKAGPSRESTLSVELVCAPSRCVIPAIAAGSVEPVVRDVARSRVSRLDAPSSGANASGVPSPNRLFGVPLQRSTPLPIDDLRYPWARLARVGVTVGAISASPYLRPDVSRIRKISEAGLADQSALALSRL